MTTWNGAGRAMRAALMVAVAGPGAAQVPGVSVELPPQTTAARRIAVDPDAPAPVATLGEALATAYRTHPDLLAARAQSRSADHRIAQARAAYGPTLDATAAYRFTRDRREATGGLFTGAEGWTSTAALLLTQPVFTFGRIAAVEAGAEAGAQYQRDLLRLSEARILADVVTAYVAVMRDAAAVTIARENLLLLDRQLADNRLRYQLRDLTETDLEQTRTRVETGRARLLAAQGELGVSQKAFLREVGAPPGDLTAPDLLDTRFASLPAAYAYAEANNALIRATRARERISRAALAAARADGRPRIDLRGTADYGSVSPYADALRTTRLAGQVVVGQPIVDSGLRRARIGEAREANDADWRLIDTALRDVRAAIGGGWDRLAALRASLAHHREAITAARRAYDGAVLQQRAGDRSTLAVLDLARDLLTTRTSYNVAVAEEYVARADLLAAAGMLEAPLLLPGLPADDGDAARWRIRRRADIPMLTDVLSALEGAAGGGVTGERPSRDDGARQALDQLLPFAPAPRSAVPGQDAVPDSMQGHSPNQE